MRERVGFKEKLLRKPRLWMGSPPKTALSMWHLEQDLKDTRERNSVLEDGMDVCEDDLLQGISHAIPLQCEGKLGTRVSPSLPLPVWSRTESASERNPPALGGGREGLLSSPEAAVPDLQAKVGCTELLRRCWDTPAPLWQTKAVDRRFLRFFGEPQHFPENLWNYHL